MLFLSANVPHSDTSKVPYKTARLNVFLGALLFQRLGLKRWNALRFLGRVFAEIVRPMTNHLLRFCGAAFVFWTNTNTRIQCLLCVVCTRVNLPAFVFQLKQTVSDAPLPKTEVPWERDPVLESLCCAWLPRHICCDSCISGQPETSGFQGTEDASEADTGIDPGI